MKCLIVNAVSLNAGDAAILEGIVRSLQDAYDGALEITVSDDAPEIAARHYPHLTFIPALRTLPGRRGPRWVRRIEASLRKWRIAAAVNLLECSPRLAHALLDNRAREHVAHVRAADIIVSTGGTYLVEHYRMARRIHEIQIAQALGKPTYLMTQSAGPFRRRSNRRKIAVMANRCEAVFLRDERSRRHLLEIGVPPEKLFVCPDLAFVLAEERAPVRAAASDRPRVAVSVRDWKHFGQRGRVAGMARYREAVAAAVRELHDLGAHITFLSTCQGIQEYWTDDSRFAAALVAKLVPDLPNVTVDSDFHSPGELVSLLGSFDLVLATRMHFGILALAAGTPTAAIAYEYKTAELFAALDLSDFVLDIQDIEAADLCDVVTRAFHQRAAVTSKIAQQLPRLRAQAAEPAAVIRSRHSPELAVVGGR